MKTRIRNRSRPTINLDGDWSQHTEAIPDGGFPLGTITLSETEGALIQLGEGEAASYVMIAEGLFHRLNARKIRLAMEKALETGSEERL